MKNRANRGGSWYASWYCHASSRLRFEPGDRSVYFGFRVLRRRKL